MKVSGSSKSPDKIEVQALAVAVFKDEKPGNGLLKTLDNAVGGMIAEAIKSEEFSAKEGETAYFHVSGKELKARRLLLVGCGSRDAFKAAKLAQMAGSATRFLRSKSVKSIGIIPRADGEIGKIAQTVVVGATMGLFEPDKYRTKDKELREIDALTVIIENADEKTLNRGAERGRIIGESINFTRDLANEPGAYMTPTIMADRAKKVAKEFGLSVDILDQKQMEKLGMGSLLGVARGSDEPPKLIILKYQPSKSRSNKRRTAGAGREGNHVRLGRHLSEARREHGVDEVRHDRSGHRDWNHAGHRATETIGAGAGRRTMFGKFAVREGDQTGRRFESDDRKDNRSHQHGR